ncbi:MAG: DUF2142 domain-containing protein [Microbacteriaceae bacterium]|nr:DUF2142 domain-containing protein [Microbacteriaceae bacterium]
MAFAALAASILTYGRVSAWLKLTILPAVIIVLGAFFFLTAGQSTGIATVGATASTSAPASSVADSAAAGSEASGAAAGGISGLLANLMDLPWLWTGGAGTWGLGWLDTPLPVSVWVLMIGVLIAMVFWGLQASGTRKSIVLVLALIALAVLPLYILWGKNLRVGEWVQPRYLLPLLLIFVGVALYGFAKDHLGISRLQAAVVFAAVAVSNSLALHNNMRRYISGLGDAGFNLNTNIEWWWNMPISPMLVWMGGSAAFALMLVGLWLWLYPKGERPGLRTSQEPAASLGGAGI